jgi:hypothetical protein
VQVKLEFITECDAQHGAMYLDDRGYRVKLMRKALVVDKPDQADPALVMTAYRAYTIDIADGDIPDKD